MKFLIVLLILLNPCFVVPLFSQTTSLTYRNTDPFLPPPGVKTITVECWGAGGAGGGNSGTSFGGGGGGGGAYSKSVLSVIPGQSYTCSVGNNSPGSNGGDGGSGGDTWFGSSSLLMAKGGSGGLAPNGAAGTKGLGGKAADGVGQIRFSGGDGGSGGSSATAGGGGGGGSAGTLTNGFSGSPGSSTGGAGASSVIGGSGGANGGNSGQHGGAQVVASGPPGGGGGGSGNKVSTNDLAGGIGGQGMIIITYSQPSGSITYDDDDGVVAPGQLLSITATFDEAIADSPVMQISLTGSNTLSPANMTKLSSTVYTFLYTVGDGEGTVTVSLSTGENSDGNEVKSSPVSGATFSIVKPSETSTVSFNNLFPTPSNLNYKDYNVTAVAIGELDLFDGNPFDGDNFPTTITSISFDLINGDAIKTVGIFEDDHITSIAQATTEGNSVSFDNLSVTAADGGFTRLILKVTFKESVIDNQQFQFVISEVEYLMTGSGLNKPLIIGSASDIDGDKNRIEVQADRLVFAQQPSDVQLNQTMEPPIVLHAQDVFGNVDLDFTHNVEITSSGTLADSPLTVFVENGFGSATDLVHVTAGSPLYLTASYSGFDDVTSLAFEVQKISQDILFDALTPVDYGSESFQLNAEASSGLPVEYTSSDPSVASIVGNMVNIHSAGVTTITASQTGNENYDVAEPLEGELIINKVPLLAKVDNKTKTYGQTNPTLTVTYEGFVNGDDESDITEPAVSTSANASSSVDSYPIVISGGSAFNYNLTLEAGVLTITKASLTVKAEDKTKTYGSANPVLTIAYTGFVNGDDPGSITPPTLNTVATVSSDVGDYPITVSGGDAQNYSLIYVDGTLTINKASQVITFTPLEQKRVGDPSFSLSATTTANLEVSYSSDNESVVSITGAEVNIIGAGTALITASQDGNNNYHPATPVTRELLVKHAKSAQSIDFQSVGDKVMGDPAFMLTASASSGLPVTFSSLSPKIAISGAEVVMLEPGNVTVFADQAGDEDFAAAPQVSQDFCINPAKPEITTSGTGSSAILLSNSATGNQWYFDGSPMNGEVSSNLQPSLTGTYTVTVQVDNCVSAPSAPYTHVITGVESLKNKIKLYPNPADEYVHLIMQHNSGTETTIVVHTALGTIKEVVKTRLTEVDILTKNYSPGQYVVQIQQGRDSYYMKFVKK